MPSTSAAGRPHVGAVDQRRVDLAELHLGQRRLDVLLQVTGVSATPAASSAFVAAAPHGTCSAQSATFSPGRRKSASPVMPLRVALSAPR